MIGTGARTAIMFETGASVPLTGAASTRYSPFTLRFELPEALKAVVGNTSNAGVVGGYAATQRSFGQAVQVPTKARGAAIAPTAVSTPERVVAAGQASLGRYWEPALATKTQAADIVVQAQAMAKAPPLTLLVNPTELSLAFTKIQSYQSRTRYGYVFEAWGGDQPTLSISGSTAGFVAGSTRVQDPFAQSGQTSSVSGYQWASRLDSLAWQNFSTLYQMYRNNGYIFDRVGASEAHLFIGSLVLEWDQWVYYGHIDSFSFTFDEGTPLRVLFEMEFKVSRMVDTAGSPRILSPLLSPNPTMQSALRATQPQPAGVRFTPGQPVSVTPGAVEQAIPFFDLFSR